MTEKIVRFFSPGGGVGWYRSVNPCIALADAGVDALYREEVPVKQDGTLAGLDGVEVLHFGVPTAPAAVYAIEQGRREGRRVIVDVDDDVWSHSPNHPQHEAFIAQESPENVRKACRAATVVTCSTAPLAKRIKRETGAKEIVVVPNAVNPRFFPRYNRPPWPIFVGWAGGFQHNEDMPLAVPGLLRLQQQFGRNVEIHIFGGDLLKGTDILHYYHPWMTRVPDHCARIGGLHVAFAPLRKSRWNRSVSAIKFLEHAMHETPMVLSAEGDYPGRPALYAHSDHDWYYRLRDLATDQRKREDLGRRAYETTLERDTTDVRLPLYRQVLGL